MAEGRSVSPGTAGGNSSRCVVCATPDDVGYVAAGLVALTVGARLETVLARFEKTGLPADRLPGLRSYFAIAPSRYGLSTASITPWAWSASERIRFTATIGSLRTRGDQDGPITASCICQGTSKAAKDGAGIAATSCRRERMSTRWAILRITMSRRRRRRSRRSRSCLVEC